jgi:Transcriptional activator TraM
VAGLDREAIIAEVARRHGILLGPEDPILATVAIHEVVLGEYIRQVEEAVTRATEEFEGATHRALEGSKTIARDVLGQTIRQGCEELQKAAQPMVEELLRELHAALDRQQALVERAEGVQRVVVTAAALTGLSVVALALLVALRLG